MSIIGKVRDRIRQIGRLERRLEKLQESLGRIEARQLRMLLHSGLAANEFRVFSQWGEDGIIQHLISQVRIERRVFVEFGIEDYTESNTRFLLVNDNWSGLVIDGGQEHIDYVRKDPIYWRYNLKAECSFITRENINTLIGGNGITGEIGLLSVDIDGNDYWVWKAIDVIDPTIVVVEYNARFGPTAAVTVPYDAQFVRGRTHPSMIYYGASLGALCKLGAEKGYALVGCNSAGNNAFFVREDRLPPSMKPLSAEAAYVRNQFREARDAAGELLYLSHEAELKILHDLPLVAVGP